MLTGYPIQKDLLLSTVLQLTAVTVTFLRWSYAPCPLKLDLPMKAANHKYAGTRAFCPPITTTNTWDSAWFIKVISDSTTAVVLNWGWFYLLGDVRRCLETFLRVTTWGVGGGVAIGNQWVETRDAAKHPTRHRTALPQQRIIVPKTSMVPKSRYSELEFSFSHNCSMEMDMDVGT